jgi:hypothetical protein
MLYTVKIELSGSENWDTFQRLPGKDVDRLIDHARRNRTVSMIQVWARETSNVVYQATRSFQHSELIEEIDEYHSVHCTNVILLDRHELAETDLDMVIEEDETKSNGY